jgi:signal transduction histidine kinase
VAHDFNNMLAVISGNAELLEGEVGADNPRLAAVIRATKRAADLTQRLLAFSRRQVLRPETINANSLITDVSGLLRRTLEEHIEIETVAAAGLWNCEVDPAQLENALINLAINARDAMPDGGKLTIETANARLDDDYAAAQAEVTPGQYVMLAVTDTGSGMSPEVREHVFEPFFTTKAVGKGTGLGLAMIYGFVKQSGGHVTVYSEEICRAPPRRRPSNGSGWRTRRRLPEARPCWWWRTTRTCACWRSHCWGASVTRSWRRPRGRRH